MPSHLDARSAWACCTAIPRRRLTGQEALRRLGRDATAMPAVDTPRTARQAVRRSSARSWRRCSEAFDTVARGALRRCACPGRRASARARCCGVSSSSAAHVARWSCSPAAATSTSRCPTRRSTASSTASAATSDRCPQARGRAAPAGRCLGAVALFPVLRQVDAVCAPRRARSRASRSRICCASGDSRRCAICWPSMADQHAGGDCHRRPAVGRPRQHRAARRVAAASGRARRSSSLVCFRSEETVQPGAPAVVRARRAAAVVGPARSSRWGRTTRERSIEALGAGQVDERGSRGRDRAGGGRQSVLPRTAHAATDPVDDDPSG